MHAFAGFRYAGLLLPRGRNERSPTRSRCGSGSSFGDRPCIGDERAASPGGEMRRGEETAGGRPVGEIEAMRRRISDLEAREARWKRAEQALSESEERFRLLAENAPVLIYRYRFRPEPAFEYISPSVARMMGYSPDEYYAHPTLAYEAVHPEDRPIFDGILEAPPSPERPFRLRSFRRDGVLIWTEHWIAPIYNEKGDYVAVQAVALDITQQVRAEDALRQSEARLRDLLEATSDWVWEVDEHGRYTYVSPQVSDLLGYSPAEVLGKTPFDFMPPEERRRVEREFSAIVRERRPFRLLENVNRRKDGRLVVLETSGVPIFDAEGVLRGYRGIGRDVTERKRVQEERERLLAELDATICSIPDGVVIYGPSAEILRINAAAERMLGFSPEELQLPLEERLARRRAETPAGEPVPLEKALHLRALRGETVQGFIVAIHLSPAKTVWVSAGAAPICTPDRRLLGAVATLTDITAIHELQEQLEDLLRTISHDLRAPLTVIQGQAQLLGRLLEAAGRDRRQRRSVEAIVAECRRMSLMIQDLVDSVRLESGQLRLRRRPVALRSFVADLLVRLTGVLDTGRVRVEIPEGLPRVRADPDRLERILINLLSNALKYSPTDTQVVVRQRRGGGVGGGPRCRDCP